MNTVLRLAAVCAVGLLAAGAARADKRLANDLKQLGLAYHNYYADFNKGPANAEALAPYFENDKRILKLLKDEDITFFFGVGILQMPAGTTNTVLACEKEAPEKGGYVLMGDGSVRKLSPEEFKKAPKAGKVKGK
jgi:hypothetical protein